MRDSLPAVARTYRSVAVVLAVLTSAMAGFADEVSEPAGNLSGSLVFAFDRDAADALAQAERDLATGQTSAGLNGLQQLLDRPADVLVERRGSYVSVWAAANHIIAGLPPDQQQAYKRLVRDPSRQSLAAARVALNVQGLSRLTHQYRHAPAGQEAALLLALLAFDRGETAAAANWCNVIVRRGGHAEMPPQLAHLRLAIDNADAAETSPQVPLPNEPLTAKGSPPQWSLEFGVASNASRVINEALGELDAQAMNPTLTCRPLLVDGRIITRTLFGLICGDAASGEMLWNQDVPSRASALARGPGELSIPIRIGQVSATLLRRLVRDSLQDELTSDGRFVYTVLSGERPIDAEPDKPFNILRAIDLATGRTQWESGPPQQPKKRFQRRPTPYFFLGPPLIVGVERLVLAQQGQTVELVSLDAEDGRTLWSLPLGQAVRDLWAPDGLGEDAPPEDRERQSTACRLSRDGSRVLCSTGAGAIVCVDAFEQRVLWAFRYPRRDLPQQPPVAGDATHFREMPVGDAFATAESWQMGGVGVCVAPDADRLFACDMETGELIWSRSRGDGFQLLPVDDDRLILLGATGVRSLHVVDGTQQWFTPTRRPVGAGVLDGDSFVLPLADEQYEVIRPTDGTFADAHRADEGEQRFTVAAHPPTGLRPIHPRNLHRRDKVVVSQSATELERIALTAPVNVPEPIADESLADMLRPVLDGRTVLAPLISVWRRIDVCMAVGDGLLIGALEAAGLRKPVEERAADLVRQLERARADDETATTNRLREALATLQPDLLYLTTADGLHSCRLDRWIDGRSAGTEQDAPSTSSATPVEASADAVHTSGVSFAWPATVPIVTEQKTSFGPSYFLRVPMQVLGESPWQDVTVEVDRQVRMIQFHDATHVVPMAVTLPPDIDTNRLEGAFLQSWAVGDVLLVRFGLEVVAFRRTEAGELPDAPLWPPRGKTLSLAGPHPPLATAMRPLSEEALPRWDETATGFEDVFGRLMGEIGPVCSAYFCYQQRGHLIAVDLHTGEELWRRSRQPVGTHAIGDDDRVVLFHDTSPSVTVLDAFDGRTIREWSLEDAPLGLAVSERQPFSPLLIRGTSVLLGSTTGDGVRLEAVDLAAGQQRWRQTFEAGAAAFPVDEERFGLATPAGKNRPSSLKFIDWSTGDVAVEWDVEGPDEFQDVVTFSDADQLYVIVSGRITDLPLLNVPQILGNLNRQVVNGRLHAFSRDGTAHLWSQPVENMAFPLVQPRHVPLLIVNDQVQPAGEQMAQGRLVCFDKRTGQTLASLTHPLHIYYALQVDAEAGRIDLRMKGRTLHFDYPHDAARP